MLKQSSALTGAKRKRAGLNVLLAGIFSACAATGQAAAIKVMSDSPLKPALAKVVELFQQATHNQVTLVFDPITCCKKAD
jgi:molybdate transport system substrate-binding protein